MKEIELKYGCNPNQKPSRIFMRDGSELPVEVINGRPGFIMAACQGAKGGNRASVGSLL